MTNSTNNTAVEYSPELIAKYKALKNMEAGVIVNNDSPAVEESKESKESKESEKTLIKPTDITFTVGMLEKFPESIVSMLEVLHTVEMVTDYKEKEKEKDALEYEYHRLQNNLEKQKNDADYTAKEVEDQGKRVTKAENTFKKSKTEFEEMEKSLRNNVGTLPEKVEASKPAMKEFKKMVEAVAPLFKELQAKTEESEDGQSKEDE